MLFRKKKRDSELKSSAQTSIVADGYSAVIETEANVCDVVGISPHCFRELSTRKGNDFVWKRILGHHNPAAAIGAAISGCRAAAIVDEPLEVDGNLPLVQQLICGSAGHSHYNADYGCFQLFASNVQEIADFSLIAHYIAEFTLVPGICAQDGQNAHSLQQLSLLDSALAHEYLHQSIEAKSPTLGQKILFGEKRPPIPCWNDIDHPATTGIQEEEVADRAMAARQTFFLDGVVEAANRAFAEYAKLTGRHYARVSEYCAKDAEYVVIAQGSVTENLRKLVDILRARENIKAGVLAITMFSPFPGKEIAKLLKGKKGVAILEKTTKSSWDLPLISQVRNALDQAIENATQELIDPNFPIYRRLIDHPKIFSGIYGLGGQNPSLSDLRAVFANMFDSGIKRKFFYVGLPANLVSPHFPKHELLQQNIRREYPQLAKLSLCDNIPVDFPAPMPLTLRIHFTNGDDQGLANLLANALNIILKKRIETSLIPQKSQSSVCTIAVYETNLPHHTIPDNADIAVMSAQQLIETPSSALAVIKKLVIEGEIEPKQWRLHLAQETVAHIQRGNLQCFQLDGRKIVCEITKDPAKQSALLVHIRLGSLIAAFIDSDEQLNAIAKEYGKLLGDDHMAVECAAAFSAGRAIEKVAGSDFQAKGAGDCALPWTIAQTKAANQPVLDLNRFWNCSGYFYQTGKKGYLLTDPFIATGAIPARSSAFSDMSGMRSFIPRLINENCTGCGKCFAACPDSAIPGLAQRLPALLENAIVVCKRNGNIIEDLPRFSKHLLQQAQRIFVADGLNRYQTLGSLFQEAFSALMGKMTLVDDQRAKVSDEFSKIFQVVQDFPIVKTDVFFNDPEAREKGTGALFSLVVSSENCKGCMECVAVCPEHALEPIVQTQERLEDYRKNWQYFLSMSCDRELIKNHSEGRATYRLLDKKAYFSLVGGDNAPAGSGEKTAIHLLTAAIEAKMGDEVATFVEKIAGVVERLEREIQESVNKALEVRDWEGFGQSLLDTSHQNFDAKALADILNNSGQRVKIDDNRLKRMAMELSRLKELLELYRKGDNGDGRARMTMIASDKCMDWGRQYPHTPFSFPCCYHRDPAGMALGVFQGTMAKMIQTFKALRMAELDICNGYTPQIHDTFFENFSYGDFTEQELALCPPVVVIVDSKEANWESLFSLIAHRLPVKIAIVDRRGSAPIDTKSVLEPGLMFLAMQDSFVLQTTSAATDHFISGVMEGIATNAPALFHIYAPDAITPNQAMTRSQLAMQSRTFPLFKYNPCLQEKLSLKGNPGIGENWSWQSASLERKIQVTPAHWAIGERHWRKHWKVAKGQHGGMKSLVEYLRLGENERKNLQPVIDCIDESGQSVCLEISESLVRFSKEQLDRWLFLKRLANPTDCIPDISETIEHIREQQEEEIHARYSDRLRQLEQEHGVVYQERLKNTLLSLYCPEGDAEMPRMKLREYVEQKRTN